MHLLRCFLLTLPLFLEVRTTHVDNLLADLVDQFHEVLVLDGLIEGISENLYYSWSKEFLEAGKRRLSGDTARQATSPEVKELRSEATALKECVADLTLENRLLKKSMTGAGEFEE